MTTAKNLVYQEILRQQSKPTQTNQTMNITIETPVRRKSGFTGHKQSPNQSLSARINNLQRSCDSKADHLMSELDNFEAWIVDNMPQEMHSDTWMWRAKIHEQVGVLKGLAETLRQYNQSKPVYELDLINKLAVTASSVKNTP